MALNVKRLREIVATLHDDMPVCIALKADEACQVNSIGKCLVGVEKKSTIFMGIPDIETVEALVLSPHDPA